MIRDENFRNMDFKMLKLLSWELLIVDIGIKA